MAITAMAFPTRIGTLTNITPFTIRDGYTYLEQLEKMRVYVSNLAPETTEELSKIIEQFNNGIANAEATITGTLGEWEARHAAFLDDVTAQLAILSDTAIGDLIVSEISDTRAALDSLIESELVRQGDLVVNVRDYGARPDAGDVTAQVQAAADDAGGRVLWFGETGDYDLRGHVILEDYTTVSMAPGAWVRKKGATTTYVAFLALAGIVPGYGASKGIAFINCNFRGDLAAGKSVNALSAHRLSGLYVTGCKFWETSQNGHVFDLQGCENILIENSEFRGIKKVAGRGYVEAIQLDSSVSTGTGFAETLVTGELFDGTPTRNVTVRNNTFGTIRVAGVTYYAQSPIGSHSYVDGRPYTNIVFSGNTIENVVENDGGYPGIVHFVASQDVKITNNKVYSDGTQKNTFVRFFRGGNAIPFNSVADPNAVTAPPTIKINPKNVTVEGNEITGLDVANPLVWVYGENGWLVPNLLVSNNRFVDCQNAAGSGVLIQGTWTEDAQVNNNRANNCGYGVVTIGDSLYPTVSGNVGNGGATYPVNIYNGVAPVVTGNRFRNYGQWVNITGSMNVGVKNNEIVVTGATAALKIITPPASPGYLHITGNTLGSTNSVQVTADSAAGISTAYTAGLITGNMAYNYAVAIDPLGTRTQANNITV